MTNKEYLINCHVLLKHFELVFIQLQLVKISCKLLIIWVNYEKKQQRVLFMKHRVMWLIVHFCQQHRWLNNGGMGEGARSSSFSTGSCRLIRILALPLGSPKRAFLRFHILCSEENVPQWVIFCVGNAMTAPLTFLSEHVCGGDHWDVLVLHGWKPFCRIWNPATSIWTTQLTWLRTVVHSGDRCLRSALRTLSAACQKWWWWWWCLCLSDWL